MEAFWLQSSTIGNGTKVINFKTSKQKILDLVPKISKAENPLVLTYVGAESDPVEDDHDQLQHELGPVVKESLHQLGQRGQLVPTVSHQSVDRTETVSHKILIKMRWTTKKKGRAVSGLTRTDFVQRPAALTLTLKIKKINQK